MNESEEPEAVYVAQVPETYHLPLEIRQPFLELEPEGMMVRWPLPEKGVPGADVEVDVGAGEVRVPVGVDETPLGRYLIPVDGHLELARGSAGSKVPA